MAVSEKLTSLAFGTSLLLRNPISRIADIQGRRELGGLCAVYDLRRPDGSILYVGRTANLALRLYDHLHTTTSSDLRGMLMRFDIKNLASISDYKVQYLEEPDSRMRRDLEYYLIAILNPPFNRGF